MLQAKLEFKKKKLPILHYSATYKFGHMVCVVTCWFRRGKNPSRNQKPGAGLNTS